ncbi:MAG: AlpA family phage regulatory protein [bacterium]|nr:AlpA family phage regulatory protein [bacterium]
MNNEKKAQSGRLYRLAYAAKLVGHTNKSLMALIMKGDLEGCVEVPNALMVLISQPEWVAKEDRPPDVVLMGAWDKPPVFRLAAPKSSIRFLCLDLSAEEGSQAKFANKVFSSAFKSLDKEDVGSGVIVERVAPQDVLPGEHDLKGSQFCFVVFPDGKPPLPPDRPYQLAPVYPISVEVTPEVLWVTGDSLIGLSSEVSGGNTDGSSASPKVWESASAKKGLRPIGRPSRFLSVLQMAEKIGLSKSSINNMTRKSHPNFDPFFPQKISIAGRILYDEGEIEEWMERKKKDRGLR